MIEHRSLFIFTVLSIGAKIISVSFVLECLLKYMIYILLTHASVCHMLLYEQIIWSAVHLMICRFCFIDQNFKVLLVFEKLRQDQIVCNEAVNWCDLMCLSWSFSSFKPPLSAFAPDVRLRERVLPNAWMPWALAACSYSEARCMMGLNGLIVILAGSVQQQVRLFN